MCANQSSYDGHISPVESEHSFNKVLCSLRVDTHGERACDCRLPCDEMIYDMSVSASGSWPHKSYKQAFYDKYVRGTSNGTKLDKHANDTVSQLYLACSQSVIRSIVILS